MIKKLLAKVIASAAVCCGLFAGAMTANAATIEDVIETARKYGIPDSMIQQGCNEYYSDPDTYDEAYLDDAVMYIELYHQEILEKLLGGTTTSANGESSQTTTTTTTTVQGTTTTPSDTSGSSNSSGNMISEEEFINMTFEEKQQYIASLPEGEKQAFLNSLSPEALKSIVKQLPADDKADVLQSFVQAGDSLGVKVTIDEINDDSISMTMRDDEGELVDVAAVGVIVEDTGYDYRTVLSVSGAMLVTAAGLLWVVIRKILTDRKTEAENE